MADKRILVTASLPYCNNVPHLGNIIGSVLSADVYSRYSRQRGRETLFICGTDDYGTASEIKAWQEGKTPKEVCDHYRKIHEEIYAWFGIQFDHFGRSSTEKHQEICQELFLQLKEAGQLQEKQVLQQWCPGCRRFLADRFIEGTCPSCLYCDARGDQCDKCGLLLDPAQLVAARCKLCSGPPEKRDSAHFFLDLEKIQPKLNEWLAQKGNWSANARSITQSWLDRGLQPRCITRDLKWGVPVPLPNYGDKVFYVWYDAPLAYLSITACHTPDWRSWWLNPANTRLVQFMGKDNVPFHSIVFPSSLLGTARPFTLVSDLSATEYLNYEGEKFSKSRGVGVFGTDARETGIPADCWRYYLLSIRPETSDANFSWTDFQVKVNNELVANLGNFVHRVLSFLSVRYQGQAVCAEPCPVTLKRCGEIAQAYRVAMDDIRLREGLKLAMDVAHLGNAYLQAEQPWRSFKSDRPRCDRVMTTCLRLLQMLVELLEPFMPCTAQRIQGMSAMPVRDVEPLFQVLTNERVAELRKKYAGK